MLTQELEKLKAEQNTGDTKATDQTNGVKAESKDDAKNEESITLGAMLEKSNAEVVDLRVKLVQAESAAVDAMALIDPLKTIVAKSLSAMRVALGGVAVESSMSAASLIAEHQKVAIDFEKKFPVGGLAAVDAVADTQKKPNNMSALESARLNAVLKK